MLLGSAMLLDIKTEIPKISLTSMSGTTGFRRLLVAEPTLSIRLRIIPFGETDATINKSMHRTGRHTNESFESALVESAPDGISARV